MKSIVDILNSQGFKCPSCHLISPDSAEFWHRTILPMGESLTVFISALCSKCHKGLITRKAVLKNLTLLRAGREGNAIGIYYKMSPSGWLPPPPRMCIDYMPVIP